MYNLTPTVTKIGVGLSFEIMSDFLKEKVFIYFFSNLGDYVSSLG